MGWHYFILFSIGDWEIGIGKKNLIQDVDNNGSIGPKYKQARANEFGDVVHNDDDNSDL